MISEVVAFTGIALDSPLGFVNGVLLVLLVGAGVKGKIELANTQYGDRFKLISFE